MISIFSYENLYTFFMFVLLVALMGVDRGQPSPSTDPENYSTNSISNIFY